MADITKLNDISKRLSYIVNSINYGNQGNRIKTSLTVHPDKYTQEEIDELVSRYKLLGYDVSVEDIEPSKAFVLKAIRKDIKDACVIVGAYNGIMISSDCKELFKIYNVETIDLSLIQYSVSNCQGMFKGCARLETLLLGDIDTSNCRNMQRMFQKCRSIKQLDLSNFKTSNVENMSHMFDECNSLLELDLSNFKTHKVTQMNQMFSNCKSLKRLNVSNFNTEALIESISIFNECESLEELDLSSFNMSHLKVNINTFYGCRNLRKLDISNFSIKDKDIRFTTFVAMHEGMFKGCTRLEELITDNEDYIDLWKLQTK